MRPERREPGMELRARAGTFQRGYDEASPRSVGGEFQHLGRELLGRPVQQPNAPAVQPLLHKFHGGEAFGVEGRQVRLVEDVLPDPRQARSDFSFESPGHV